MSPIRSSLRRLLGAPAPIQAAPASPAPEASPENREIVERVRPFTMTSVDRLEALIDAVRYCVRREIPGAFAECGVWRGGSVLAMILTLQELGAAERDVHLFDTFEGMTAPTAQDVSAHSPPALDTWSTAVQRGAQPWEGYFRPELVNIAAVRETVLSSGYPAGRVHLAQGPVEETLPSAAPDALALVRLDTDWYESTAHEMRHLYPRLSPGGVLIIDDYGHWEGARKAVDEYFATEAPPLLLNRIDYTGRIAVKT